MGLFGFGKDKKKIESLRGQNWESYSKSSLFDNSPIIVECNMDVVDTQPKELTEQLTLVLSIPADRLTKDLLPDRQEREVLDVMEKTVLKSVETPARLVGKITQEGYREFVFQTSNAHQLESNLAGIYRKIGVYKPACRTSKGWTYFNNAVRPDAMAIQVIEDRKVIMTMVSLGAELGSVQKIEHLFIGDPKHLRSMLDALKLPEGFQSYLQEDRLLLTHSIALVAPLIAKLTYQFKTTASEHDVLYDGWGGLIKK